MLGSALVILGAAITVWGFGEETAIGKGVWMVESMDKCPDADSYPYQIDLKKRKVDRTHDAFYGTLYTPKEINESSHGVFIDVCKKVDGGCKQQYTFDEPSMCNFIKQYAEDNFYAALSNMGLDNPDCPIPEGDKKMEGYSFNYYELPEEGMLGRYSAKAYITEKVWEDQQLVTKRVGCFMVDLQFNEPEESDD